MERQEIDTNTEMQVIIKTAEDGIGNWSNLMAVCIVLTNSVWYFHSLLILLKCFPFNPTLLGC